MKLIRAGMHMGENETTGFSQPWDEKSREFPTSFLKFLIEWHRENGARLLSKMQNELHRGN